MKDVIQGKVYVVGDDINTDVIIPARYLTTMDPKVLGKHAMEDLDPEKYPVPFLNKDGTCDYKIVIAGKNFGCGSSREHAPIALNAVGIEAVVAKTFARIYYRNSVNGGIILPLECGVDLSKVIETGSEVKIDLSGDPRIWYRDAKKVSYGDAGKRWSFINPFGPVKDIIEAGGLTNYNKKRLDYTLRK